MKIVSHANAKKHIKRRKDFKLRAFVGCFPHAPPQTNKQTNKKHCFPSLLCLLTDLDLLLDPVHHVGNVTLVALRGEGGYPAAVQPVELVIGQRVAVRLFSIPGATVERRGPAHFQLPDGAFSFRFTLGTETLVHRRSERK